MQTTIAPNHRPPSSDNVRRWSQCDLGRGQTAFADFSFSDQPNANDSVQAFILHSLEKFIFAVTTIFRSYHRNQQYSVIAFTNDTGAIVERYSYTAYGEPAFFDGSGSVISNSQISNRFTYTGREYDSVIRLYHYRARMYDFQLGRFLGRDPIKLRGGFNLYRFVSCGPIRFTDPYGLTPQDWTRTGNTKWQLRRSRTDAYWRLTSTRYYKSGTKCFAEHTYSEYAVRFDDYDLLAEETREDPRLQKDRDELERLRGLYDGARDDLSCL